MEIPSGHIIAAIGTNGAGKSTFVYYLCGLLKKARGDFVLSEKPFHTKDRLQPKDDFLSAILRNQDHFLLSREEQSWSGSEMEKTLRIFCATGT